jgi:hypothetical protein
MPPVLPEEGGPVVGGHEPVRVVTLPQGLRRLSGKDPWPGTAVVPDDQFAGGRAGTRVEGEGVSSYEQRVVPAQFHGIPVVHGCQQELPCPEGVEALYGRPGDVRVRARRREGASLSPFPSALSGARPSSSSKSSSDSSSSEMPCA